MTRAAIPARCQRCRAEILVGYDADVAAVAATVDNTPLTRNGELLAIIAGRRTYRLDVNGHLHHRQFLRMRRPVERGQAVAEHRCGEPIPATWRQPPKPRPIPTNNQEVPF